MTTLARLILIFLLLTPTPLWAAVANDGSTESHTGTTGSASEASFTWNFTPTSGTPQGIILFTCGLSSATNDVTSVTYGGVGMTAVAGGFAADTVAEVGNVQAWFLGASIPTGLQAFVVNRNNNANIIYAAGLAVTASGDTTTHDAGIVLLQENGALAEQSIDDGSPGTNSLRAAGLYSGEDTITTVTAGANSFIQQSIDIGLNGCVTGREATAGQGARSMGFVDGTSEDRAAVHVAIKEIGGGPALQSGGVNVIGAGL